MSARRRRSQCPTPSKVRYPTKTDAQVALRAMAWMAAHESGHGRLYWCSGGHYHLTGRI